MGGKCNKCQYGPEPNSVDYIRCHQCNEEHSLFKAISCYDCKHFANDVLTGTPCQHCSDGSKFELEKDNQTAKADAGKPQITLVPRKIIWDIAKIRMYGNQKYGDPNNWKQVSQERYRDALMRHLLLYLDDPKSVDDESGLPHLWHAACNMAFLCEMEDWE